MPTLTPAMDSLLAHGWRLEPAPLTTGSTLALACSPDGLWGCAIVRDRTVAALDAGYLAAAVQACVRAGSTPPWLAALAGLPCPPAPWAVFDLDARLLSLEKRCIAAGWDDGRICALVRCLAAEFED